MIKLFIYSADALKEKNIREEINSLPFGAAERERLLNISNKKHQYSSLSAYIALATLLKPLENFCDLEIERGSNGKPYFKNHPDIKFNLSHSRNIAVAAIEENTKNDIGVDIEFFNTKTDFKSISKRFFGEELSTAENFFASWTLKEAYTKMQGNTLIDCIALQVPKSTYKQFVLRAGTDIAYLSICSASLENTNETEIIKNHEEITVNELQA